MRPSRQASILSLLVLLLLLRGLSLVGQDLVRETGHYDLAVNYDPATGWDTYIRDYAAGPLSPLRTIFHLGENTRTTVPPDPDFRFLGGAGEEVWILPEIFASDRVYLGIGAPLLGRNLFTGGLSNRGQLTMRLIGLSGSGPESGGQVALWQSAFPPRIHFASADGLGPEDTLDSVTANFHAHYNWGFTRPGLYRMTFAFSGTLLPQFGGMETSTTVTYSFEVLNSLDPGPLRHAWHLDETWSWSSWLGTFSRLEAPWIYSFGKGWLYFLEGSPDSFWLYSPEAGWAWSSQHLFPWIWPASTGIWEQL